VRTRLDQTIQDSFPMRRHWVWFFGVERQIAHGACDPPKSRGRAILVRHRIVIAWMMTRNAILKNVERWEEFRACWRSGRELPQDQCLANSKTFRRPLDRKRVPMPAVPALAAGCMMIPVISPPNQNALDFEVASPSIKVLNNWGQNCTVPGVLTVSIKNNKIVRHRTFQEELLYSIHLMRGISTQRLAVFTTASSSYSRNIR
jgi:hypothetical protein